MDRRVLTRVIRPRGANGVAHLVARDDTRFLADTACWKSFRTDPRDPQAVRIEAGVPTCLWCVAKKDSR